jgi:SOS-response transcriptional repressor LexA
MGTMKKIRYPNGLRKAMEKAGKGPTELADRLDTNKQNITRWSNGDRKLTVEWAKKLAPLLGTTADVLLLVSNDNAPPDHQWHEVTQVPLLEKMPAGKLKQPMSQVPPGDFPKLAFSGLGRGAFFALTVEGDSMDRIAPDGAVIIVDKSDTTLIAGKCYVVSGRSGLTFKVWKPNPPRWAPASTNPIHEPIFVKTKEAAQHMVVGRVKRAVVDL